MNLLATVPAPDSFLTGDSAEVLVGRLVANTEFVRALHRYGSFDGLCLFVGEPQEGELLTDALVGRHGVDPRWLRVRNVLELPSALSGGEIALLHQLSHTEPFPDLLWLRDRYATRPLPVTAQVHSLSYPRLMRSYLAMLLHPPGEQDAIFCSSRASRRVVEGLFSAARGACSPGVADAPPRACELPVVPLGVDTDTLARGNRERARRELDIPADALVVLVLARFSPHDKVDLHPVLQAFRDVLTRPVQPARPLLLLLAGARQRSEEPEAVSQWAETLGIAERLRIRVDFPDTDRPDLLAASDLLVSPVDNLQETFGLCIVEAMAAGLPVIASDFDGYRDLVTTETGILVPTRWVADPERLTALGPVLSERALHLMLAQSIEIDLRALGDAIHDLVMDDARRAAMAAAARERARACYDWKVVIAQYEEVWRRLASSPRRPRPESPAPPLAMPFRTLFAHYPGSASAPGREVRRLPLADQLIRQERRYPLHPDLEVVFDGDDVGAGLVAAGSPASVERLAATLEARWEPGEAWRAHLLVAWLLKHGLIG